MAEPFFQNDVGFNALPSRHALKINDANALRRPKTTRQEQKRDISLLGDLDREISGTQNLKLLQKKYKKERCSKHMHWAHRICKLFDTRHAGRYQPHSFRALCPKPQKELCFFFRNGKRKQKKGKIELVTQKIDLVQQSGIGKLSLSLFFSFSFPLFTALMYGKKGLLDQGAEQVRNDPKAASWSQRDFAVTTRSLRGHYAVTTRSLRSLRGHYAVTTRSLRGHYGHYAVTTRSLRGHYGHYAVTARSLRGHYAVTTRSPRGHYGHYAVTTRTLRQKELHVRG